MLPSERKGLYLQIMADAVKHARMRVINQLIIDSECIQGTIEGNRLISKEFSKEIFKGFDYVLKSLSKFTNDNFLHISNLLFSNLNIEDIPEELLKLARPAYREVIDQGHFRKEYLPILAKIDPVFFRDDILELIKYENINITDALGFTVLDYFYNRNGHSRVNTHGIDFFERWCLKLVLNSALPGVLNRMTSSISGVDHGKAAILLKQVREHYSEYKAQPLKLVAEIAKIISLDELFFHRLVITTLERLIVIEANNVYEDHRYILDFIKVFLLEKSYEFSLSKTKGKEDQLTHFKTRILESLMAYPTESENPDKLFQSVEEKMSFISMNFQSCLLSETSFADTISKFKPL